MEMLEHFNFKVLSYKVTLNQKLIQCNFLYIKTKSHITGYRILHPASLP